MCQHDRACQSLLRVYVTARDCALCTVTALHVQAVHALLKGSSAPPPEVTAQLRAQLPPGLHRHSVQQQHLLLRGLPLQPAPASSQHAGSPVSAQKPCAKRQRGDAGGRAPQQPPACAAGAVCSQDDAAAGNAGKQAGSAEHAESEQGDGNTGMCWDTRGRTKKRCACCRPSNLPCGAPGFRAWRASAPDAGPAVLQPGVAEMKTFPTQCRAKLCAGYAHADFALASQEGGTQGGGGAAAAATATQPRACHQRPAWPRRRAHGAAACALAGTNAH